MRPFRLFALMGIYLLGLAGSAGAGVIYVKAGATGAQNGLSWANAYADLQAALATAQSGDEIWVAAGTYKPTMDTLRTKSFVMPAGVALYGGFAGGETARNQRDWAAHATILSGDIGAQGNATDNSYHVVVGGASAVLDGFTVSGGTGVGTTMHGAGMINDGVSPTIANCIFSRNTSDNDGGGMYNTNNASPTVDNCLFTSNTTTHGFGGGMVNTDNTTPTISNCTFTGNMANGGGGLANFSGSPTVINCTFNGNTANGTYGIGGGMHNYNDASPTVTNCTFSGNMAKNSSGGMAINYGTVTHCTFSGNTANGGGGGMSNSHGMVTNCTFTGNTTNNGSGGGMSNGGTVTKCNFSGNTANSYGGGMINRSGTVTNCTFSGNKSDFSGGGMSNDSGTVTHCTFSGNTANVGGGGVYNNGSPTMENCTISDNTATSSGGGMYNYSGDPKLTNCTFSRNKAINNTGGGMFTYSGTPSITNCIFWGDTAPYAPETYAYYNSNPTLHHCNIQGSGGSGDYWDPTLGTDGGGNIAADPRFVNAANPAGADGVWRTADDGLALQADSPCINAGTLTGAPTKDILDQTRSGAPDLGAYEYLRSGQRPRPRQLRRRPPRPPRWPRPRGGWPLPTRSPSPPRRPPARPSNTPITGPATAATT